MTNEIMYWHIHALLGVFTLFLIIDFLKEQNNLFKKIGIYFVSSQKAVVHQQNFKYI